MLSKGRETGAHARPYLRNRDVQWGYINVQDLPLMDFDSDDARRFSLVPGDVLVCEGGEVGRAAIWTGQLKECHFQKALHRVRTSGALNPSFLRYLLEDYARTKAFEQYTSGSTISHLPQEDLRNLPVPIPPLAEQERIVAAIEEQFSRLDVAETALSRARHRLARLRLAVLRTAVENPAWPKKRLAEIVTTSSGGTPSRRRPEYFGGTIPWVKSGELRDGRVSTCEETITQLGLKNSSAKVFERGTLLIALYGATVGKLGILDIDAATNQAVCAIVPHDPEMVAYLLFVLRSKRPELIAAGQGGAQPNISQTILNGLTIPVPPRDEQLVIAAHIERTLSNVDVLTRAVEVALDHSRALRRAILRRAFSGELVPQNPTDEPASVLLDRISSERAFSGEPKAVPARRKPTKRAVEDADRRERRSGIKLMWEDGYSMAEIAETMEMSPTSLGNETTRMRREGWDLPYRRRKASA